MFRSLMQTLTAVAAFLAGGILVAAAADERTAFRLGRAKSDHDFRSPGGGVWYETDGGKITFKFRETGRTAEAVTLVDAARGMTIRLTDTKAEYSTDSVKFSDLGNGRWVDFRRLAAVPLPAAPDFKVRLIYFVAADRMPTANYEAKIRTLMQFVSEFYRDDLRAKGYTTDGPQFETVKGQIVVHLVQGSKPARFYNGYPKFDENQQDQRVMLEIPQSIYQQSEQMGIIFTEVYETTPAPVEWNGGIAHGGPSSNDAGAGFFSAWILQDEFCPQNRAGLQRVFSDTTPVTGRTAMGHGGKNSPRFEFVEDGMGAVIHELGHALGLPHDRDPKSVMGSGFRDLRANVLPGTGLPRVGFGPESARMLMCHRCLNTALDRSDAAPPTCQAELLSKPTPGITRLGVKVSATDDKALRAVIVQVEHDGGDYVAGGQELSGKEQAVTINLKLEPLKRGPLSVNVTISDQGGNRTTTRIADKLGK